MENGKLLTKSNKCALLNKIVFFKMVRIAILLLISLPSVAMATNGFYFSAASLTSKQNAISTQTISAANVTYSDNTAGLKFVDSQTVNSVAYRFTDAVSRDINRDIATLQNLYIKDAFTIRLLSLSDSITVVTTYDTYTGMMTGRSTTATPTYTNNTTNASANTPKYSPDPNPVINIKIIEPNIGCVFGSCIMYTVAPEIHTTHIDAIKTQIATEFNDSKKTPPNFTINNNLGFELSAGYKLQYLFKKLFIAPQIEYSSFGANSSSIKPTALSIVGKLGVSLSKIDFYGFGGYSSISSASNGSTQNIGGFKYGLGTEFAINENFAIFAEVFQINLNANNQSVTTTYSPSVTVEGKYASAKSADSISYTFTNTVDPKYTLNLNQISLEQAMDKNSIKITRNATIESIQGFKVGLAVYFNSGGESYYYNNDEESYY